MNEEEIHLIEIAQVFVANPRPRNPVKFQALVASIELLGLKKPITVCPRPTATGSFQYELITGQGRDGGLPDTWQVDGSCDLRRCPTQAAIPNEPDRERSATPALEPRP